VTACATRIPQGAELLKRHVLDAVNELSAEMLMVSTIEGERVQVLLASGDSYSEVIVPADCVFDEVRALLVRASRRMTPPTAAAT
jgi:hypothetical protein